VSKGWKVTAAAWKPLWGRKGWLMLEQECFLTFPENGERR